MARLSAGERRLGGGGSVVHASSAVTASLAGKVAEVLTLVALVTLVPRAFGAADYGQFTLALAVVTIGSSAAALGGPMLLTRFVPAAAPAERQALAFALATRLVRLRAGQAAGFAVVAIVLALAAPDRFDPAPTLLVGLALVLDIFATLAFQLALGLGATTAWSFRFPLQNAVLVGAGLLLHDVAGPTGAVAAIPLSSGVALVAGAAALVGRLERRPERIEVPPEAIRFGLLQALSGLFVQIGHRGPVVAVVLLAGSGAQAGFAALATGIALAGTYVVWQAFTVELPRLAAAAATDRAGAEAGATALARQAVAVVLPLSLGAVLVLPWLLPHVAGAEFSRADAALVPALAVLPFAPLTALLTQLAALRIDGGARAAAFGVGGLAFVVVAVLAVPRWEAVGATAALLAGTAATAIAAPIFVRGVYGPRLLGVALAGAAAVVLVGALA